MTVVEKRLLTVPEWCEATGYSRSFTYIQIAEGNIRVVRAGRTVRIPVEAIGEFAAAHAAR